MKNLFLAAILFLAIAPLAQANNHLKLMELEDELEIEVFPNPCNQYVNFVLPSDKQIYSVANIFGAEVYRFISAEGMLYLETSKFGNGFYFIRPLYGGQTIKFLVHH